MQYIKGYSIDVFEESYPPNSKGWARVRCLNPEHLDEHPSCSFNILSGYAKCWVCGYSANIEELKQELGIIGGFPKKIYELNFDDDTDYTFVYKLPEAINNRYLQSRGFDNNDVLVYNIKYMTDAVLFPFYNGDNVVGYQKRNVNNDGIRYITKGAKPVLYKPKDKVLEYDKVYVAEGIFGAMALNKLGFQSVAILGTGNIKMAMKHLSAFDKVYLCLDNDDAGQKATKEALKYKKCHVYIGETEIDKVHIEGDNFEEKFKLD